MTADSEKFKYCVLVELEERNQINVSELIIVPRGRLLTNFLCLPVHD